ncbi:MAG: MucR family transcriptional regulator [Alphaproteobacteria bacterium]|nr:MucR family transcriptional regulator [Hyphomonas sp.]MBR9805676.1 MucR family transcriptional regulator [Alphaproteobacteria bacterium]
MSETQQTDFLTMTSRIVSSYVANNTLEAEQLPELIRKVYETCTTLSETSQPQAESLEPAIAVSKSITPDFLICLEDGRKLKMLKRYLRSRFNMTPDEYREKWNLPADYPMVAPNYAKLRSKHAKQIGLGKKAPAKKSK